MLSVAAGIVFADTEVLAFSIPFLFVGAFFMKLFSEASAKPPDAIQKRIRDVFEKHYFGKAVWQGGGIKMCCKGCREHLYVNLKWLFAVVLLDLVLTALFVAAVLAASLPAKLVITAVFFAFAISMMTLPYFVINCGLCKINWLSYRKGTLYVDKRLIVTGTDRAAYGELQKVRGLKVVCEPKLLSRLRRLSSLALCATGWPGPK